MGIGFSDLRDVPGKERAVEAYYRVVMADWLTFVANVQWINGGTHGNVVVPGLRALLSF